MNALYRELLLAILRNMFDKKYTLPRSKSIGTPELLSRAWKKLHLDLPLLLGLFLLTFLGLIILYSAGNKDLSLFMHQLTSFVLAFAVMLLFANISPYSYQRIAPWLFLLGFLLLAAVLGIGVISKGAQRWLSLGLVRFQPAEIMKLAMPMMLAWYLRDKTLPIKTTDFLVCSAILLLPVLMIFKQPDLGTAIIVAATGIFVLLLAGITWKLFFSILTLFFVIAPVAWHFMHSYQKARILTMFAPEKDPLGTGYNIIQAKIAIGSGGLLGKGWLHGTQAHLQFLPEHATDFIFAVCGEEFGLLGCLVLLAVLLYIVGRCFYISATSQDTFCRLLAGSITLTFFISFFINIGMVIGILPVVGVPLPLVSYGGSSLISFMASFGIIMSVRTHRKFIEL